MYKIIKKEEIVDGVSKGAYYFISSGVGSSYNVMCISESEWEEFKKIVNEK